MCGVELQQNSYIFYFYVCIFIKFLSNIINIHIQILYNYNTINYSSVLVNDLVSCITFNIVQNILVGFDVSI